MCHVTKATGLKRLERSAWAWNRSDATGMNFQGRNATPSIGDARTALLGIEMSGMQRMVPQAIGWQCDEVKRIARIAGTRLGPIRSFVERMAKPGSASQGFYATGSQRQECIVSDGIEGIRREQERQERMDGETIGA